MTTTSQQLRDDDDLNALADAAMSHRQLKNNAALARALSVVSPVISKLGADKSEIDPAILIRLHEASNLPTDDRCLSV